MIFETSIDIKSKAGSNKAFILIRNGDKFEVTTKVKNEISSSYEEKSQFLNELELFDFLEDFFKDKEFSSCAKLVTKTDENSDEIEAFSDDNMKPVILKSIEHTHTFKGMDESVRVLGDHLVGSLFSENTKKLVHISKAVNIDEFQSLMNLHDRLYTRLSNYFAQKSVKPSITVLYIKY